MREFDRIGLVAMGPEVLSKRAPTSKTFDLGNGQFNLQQTMGLIHYDNNGLADIDLEPVDGGDWWLLDKAPYTLKVAKGTPQLTLTDRATGFVYTLSLVSINAASFTAPSCVPEPHPNGHALSFAGLLGDGDLHIVLTPSGVMTQQTIRSANGLKSLLWNVNQSNPDPVVVETAIRAQDANDAKIAATINRSPLVQNGSMWQGTFQEQAIPQIQVADKKTRVLSAGGAAIYPLTVIS